MKNPHRKALVDLLARANSLHERGLAVTTNEVVDALVDELNNADAEADGRDELSYGTPPFDTGVGCED